MQKSSLFLALGLAFFSITPSHAAGDNLAEDVLNSLYTMKGVYRATYAPAEWKKSFSGYDLDAEFEKAKAAVEANPSLTLQDSRNIIKNFIYSMKDYHTSISFISTEVATLPFQVKGAEGRYFIMYIDRAKLPSSSFPFSVGDELVTFGGKPIAEAIAEVQSQVIENVPATDQALAEMYLTRRQASRGYVVPKGPISIGVKASDFSDVVNYQMVWDYTPEKIKPRTSAESPAQKLLSLGSPGIEKAKSKLFTPQMTVDFSDDRAFANPYALGSKKTFTPALGLKLWESAETDYFHSYMYKAADGKIIGYIRIASYVQANYAGAIAEFAKTMSFFEARTDALVIDQVDNPGGSVFYLYALASILATQPLQTPLHRMTITQEDVESALSMIPDLEKVQSDEDAIKTFGTDEVQGYPVSYEFAQFALNYARLIVDEWNAGNKITGPSWIAGVNHINPMGSGYTKPILLLVNALDFSGGDFFPAIMQDNKRVTVLGSRTAGAGGYVNNVTVPNNIGIASFRTTGSIAERVNLNPIENLGVTPDVGYNITARDLTQNYPDYVKKIQETVLSLIK